MTSRRKRPVFPYAALTPALAFMFAAMAYPVLHSVYISFLDYRIARRAAGKPFVGLANYFYIFTDPVFWQSLGQTLYFSVWSLSLEMIFALGLALVLARPLRGVGIIRGMVLLPWMMASAVSAVIWAWIFEGSFGLANYVLLSLGLIEQPVIWLASVGTAMWVVIWIDIWRETPVMTMMLVAGLQSIPGELYEAASIDGAGGWQKFFRITLPLLRPAILLVLILRTMIVLRVYDVIAILTGGGPAGTTEVLGTYLYKSAFSSYNLGRASSASVILLLITLVISLGYIKMIPEREA